MRIGHGYDAHQFEKGKQLVLCGVQIDSPLGLKAHSDGDVAIHALCDAMLGAAALGDIGKHFPDTSDQYKNIDSRLLLRHVVDLLKQAGYEVGNVDMTIIAQVPKLAPYIKDMRKVIASDLAVNLTEVNIKATTTEYMGFVGRKEGISSHAVVLLNSVS
jgi:2-C-methyl-D-erythritol 2,4-cyclodiphosphate synthase